MNRILFTLLLTILGIQTKAQWQAQNSNSSAYLTGVHFTDLYHGWISGTDGTILHTADAGATWSPQASDETVHFRSVHFINKDTGYIAGDGGVIIKTTDGGLHWVRDSLKPHQDVDFRDIFCVGQWCIAGGIGGDVFYTNAHTEGWVSRTSLSGNVYAMYFNDTLNGWMAKQTSDGIKYTTDGGKNWSGPSASTVDMWSVYSYNPSTAWMGSNNGYVHLTLDNGSNWTKYNTGNFSEINGIYFTTIDTGWLMQKDGSIYTSADTGKSWQLNNTPFGSSFFGYYVLNNDHQWAVGSGGKIYASFDANEYTDRVTKRYTGQNKIKVSPNPFTNEVTVKINTSTSTPVQLQLKDIQGKSIWVHEQNIKGDGTITLSANQVPNLSPGIYLLYTTIGNQQKTIKLLKQE